MIVIDSRFTTVLIALRTAAAIAKELNGKVYHKGNGVFEVRS
jgi:hypothetical protein